MRKTLFISCVILAGLGAGAYVAVIFGISYLFAKADTATAIVPSLTSHTVHDITYCTPDGQAQQLDMYIPNKANTTFPLVMYIHGGSWVSGSKDEEAITQYLPTLADAGYVVASINYRLAPRYTFPAQVNDVKCAIRFLRAHASMYAINPQYIGVVGESAGGYLAAFTGVTGDSAAYKTNEYLTESDAVQAVVDLSGPTDFTVDNASDRAKHIAYTFLGAASPASASPVTHIHAGAPPFLIIHGVNDTIVPVAQSEQLKTQLVNAGTSVQLVIVQNAGHSLDATSINPSLSQLALIILSFLRAHL